MSVPPNQMGGVPPMPVDTQQVADQALQQTIQKLQGMTPDQKVFLASKAAMHSPPPDTAAIDQHISGNPGASAGAVPGQQPPAPTAQQGTPGTQVPTSQGQAPQPGPPKDATDYHTRREGWLSFMDKLTSNPMFGDMMLKFGTSLLQPVQPGQSRTGHFAQALMGGVQYAKNEAASAQKTKMAQQIADARTTAAGAAQQNAQANAEYKHGQTQQLPELTKAALMKAKAALIAAEKGNKSAAAQAVDQFAKALQSTFPGKYHTYDSAYVAAQQFLKPGTRMSKQAFIDGMLKTFGVQAKDAPELVSKFGVIADTMGLSDQNSLGGLDNTQLDNAKKAIQSNPAGKAQIIQRAKDHGASSDQLYQLEHM